MILTISGNLGYTQGEIDQICYTPRYHRDIVFIISREHSDIIKTTS